MKELHTLMLIVAFFVCGFSAWSSSQVQVGYIFTSRVVDPVTFVFHWCMFSICVTVISCFFPSNG